MNHSLDKLEMAQCRLNEHNHGAIDFADTTQR
jgi:hypothetical protein